MKFWSNVEKEYNDLFGDGDDESKQDDEDEGKMESEFNNMFTDIKKDLKNVPKEDLLPGISAPVASDSENDDGEFDEEDARKALKIGDKKKKRNKKCKVGDKSYEVGERWKDPKTGKDMICILMNIPKDVQPKLEEADVTITRDEVKPESKELDLKPTTSGPQWAYTNKLPKSRGCPSDKESEKPDQVGSEAEKDDSTHQEGQAEDLGSEIKPLGDLSLLDKETENVDKDDTQDEQTGEEVGNLTEPSEKDSDTRGSGGKESDENSEKRPSENEAKIGRLEENENNEADDEETETDTDSEEERRQAEKEAQNADESEYEEIEEDKIKYKTDNKDSEINVTKEDRETAVVQTEEPEKSTEPTKKRPEGKTETEKEERRNKEVTENIESKSLEPTTATEEVPETHEKGETIYTKETTVTQRKLFKTSETIESVETEKNVK